MGELKITQSQNHLQLKPDATSSYIIFPFIAFMLWKVVPEFFRLLPPEDKGDYIGIAFIGIWILVLLWASVIGVIRRLSAKVELNPQGIHYTDCFRKREIPWCELKDYGISYNIRSKGRKQYTLYFSEDVLPEKKRNKKNLKGVVIQLAMDERDYATVVTKVIPYCQQRITSTKPYIAE